MAIKETIGEMLQRGFTNVNFESDSKIVVDAISSSQLGISEFSLLISNIKSLLLSNPNFEVKFVKRQTNMVAHSFARAAYSIASCRIFYLILRCIDNYLINDMS
jgi:ribonuclease HI